jgi:hypothetical protein
MLRSRLLLGGVPSSEAVFRGEAGRGCAGACADLAVDGVEVAVDGVWAFLRPPRSRSITIVTRTGKRGAGGFRLRFQEGTATGLGDFALRV